MASGETAAESSVAAEIDYFYAGELLHASNSRGAPTSLFKLNSAPVVKFVTESQAAKFLIEQVSSEKLDKKVSVLSTRMMLQLFSVPSLMAYLADAAVVPTGKPDGSVKIQLDFIKLPKEILPELEKLMSTEYFKGHRLLKYVKNGQARTGLEIEVTPKCLPGDPYDYAY